MDIVETERLRLREMGRGDADHLMTIFSDPVAMKYYPSTKTRDEAIRWIQWNTDSYETNGFGLWLVERKEDGQFLGQCGLTLQTTPRATEPEIGYLFARAYWGRGYATEAATACRDWGFERLAAERLISIISIYNQPSIRVAMRVGMNHAEDFVKASGVPHHIYAISRADWQTR